MKTGLAEPLLDPCFGAPDLEQKTIKMTGEGAFVSDPLRVLRAIRLSAALGFDIDPQTKDAIAKQCSASEQGIRGAHFS